jgi:DHA1 family bicyclomycin/chloramphenicol resistance-like MFS transporter
VSGFVKLRPNTFALTAIGPLSTDMYLPSLPSIAADLHSGTAQVGLTISAYLIGFALGQIIYGPISDRHGRKPVLIAAIALYIAATLACVLSTSIDMLIAARTLQALGGSGGIVLTRAVVRDLYTGARAGRELSLIGSVMALAPVLAPVAGGVLQTASGWRAIFLVLLAAGAILAVVVWQLMPETLEQRAEQPVSLRTTWDSYKIVARNPRYLAYLGLGSLSFGGLFGWISGSSFVLQNLYGLTPSMFGLYFAIGSVGYMIGTTLAAYLVVRMGIDATLGVGSAALALGGLGMAAAVALGMTSALSLVLPVAVFLAGLGMVLPQSIAGAMQPFPERAGAASSLLGFVQQTGAALCGAFVVSLLGTSAWPLAGTVAVMSCATLLLWLLTRRLRGGAGKAD